MRYVRRFRAPSPHKLTDGEDSRHQRPWAAPSLSPRDRIGGVGAREDSLPPGAPEHRPQGRGTAGSPGLKLCRRADRPP